ncbi:MAG: NAD(+)/NADH kinase [Pirellulales bacterium]|nr:NAD(+)/NADH kinase [Pirellulales bacterium]
MATSSSAVRKFTAPGPPRTIVLGSGERPLVAAAASELRSQIESHCQIVAWDLTFAIDPADYDAELVIVLGGDGSILRAVRKLGEHQRPILGINLGRLGFLADLRPAELPVVLPALTAGQTRIVDHLMFHCEHRRGERVLAHSLGLNEVVVHAGPPFAMLEVDFYVDAELVTTYSCDGLIVSTPVGSTAHSLSAGGPILRKDLQAFVVSPISPHTLTNRPVVDAAERCFELVVNQPNPGTDVVVDGQVLGNLQAGDRVSIWRASTTFQLIEVPGHSYYKTLREKLGWSGQLHPGS